MRWPIKNMTGVSHRPRTVIFKVCVVFSYQAGVVSRPWAWGAHVGDTGWGEEVLGWRLIGVSCDMCCSDVSSHSSTDQVKGVMTLQGDALCQAVSTCHTSCFVLQGGRSPWLCITSDQCSLSVLPNWPRCFSNHWNLSRSTSDIPFYHHYHGGECCSQLPWEIPSLYHLCYVITNFLEDLLGWGHVSCLNPDLLNTFQPILHINTILWKHWGSGQDCSLPWWSGGRECDCQHPSSAYRHFLLSCVCFFFQGC